MRKWQKALAAILVLAAAVALAPVPAAAGDPNRYVDAEQWPTWAVKRSGWYVESGELADAIRFELVRGYPVPAKDQWRYYDREFRFYNPVTRGEFATMLSRSLALAADGQGGDWFRPHVEALKALGVIPPDASSDWAAAITRREAGQWMGRAAEAFRADADRDLRTFSDVDDPLILRAVRAGIVKGTGEGRFEPERVLNRGEAAIMLVRLARAMNSEGHEKDPEVFRQLTEVIKEADRREAARSIERVRTGEIAPVDPGGIQTEEFAEYLRHQSLVQLWQAPKDHREWTWVEYLDSKYKFELVEAHDNIAVVRVSDAAVVIYRGLGRENLVNPEYHYSEVQYLVRRHGRWLLSAAA